ncbi:11280_t:CDS:1, partial [Ambispora gerdemannii]
SLKLDLEKWKPDLIHEDQVFAGKAEERSAQVRISLALLKQDIAL